MYWATVLAGGLIGLMLFGSESVGFYVTMFLAFTIAAIVSRSRSAASPSGSSVQPITDLHPAPTSAATAGGSNSNKADITQSMGGTGQRRSGLNKPPVTWRKRWTVALLLSIAGIAVLCLVTVRCGTNSETKASPPLGPDQSLVAREIENESWSPSSCLYEHFAQGMLSGQPVPPEAKQFCALPWNPATINAFFEIVEKHRINMRALSPRTPSAVFDAIEASPPAIYRFWKVSQVLPAMLVFSNGGNDAQALRKLFGDDLSSRLTKAATEVSWASDPISPETPVIYSLDDTGNFNLASDQFSIRSMTDLARALTPTRFTKTLRKSWALANSRSLTEGDGFLLTTENAVRLYMLAGQLSFAFQSQQPYPRRLKTSGDPLLIVYAENKFSSSCSIPVNRAAFFCPEDGVLTISIRSSGNEPSDDPLGLSMSADFYHELSHILYDPPSPSLQPFVAEGRATGASERWQQINLAAIRASHLKKKASVGIDFLNGTTKMSPTAAQTMLQNALLKVPPTPNQAQAICSILLKPITFDEIRGDMELGSTAFNALPKMELLRAYQIAWATFNYGQEEGERRVLAPLDVRPVRMMADEVTANQTLSPERITAVARYVDQLNKAVEMEAKTRHITC